MYKSLDFNRVSGIKLDKSKLARDKYELYVDDSNSTGRRIRRNARESLCFL